MKKSVLFGWVAALGALIVTSCGGSSSDTASEGAYVAALAKTIATENAFGGGAENANCLAAGIVKAIGVKALAASNIEPADFASSTNLNLSGVGENKLDKVVDFLLSGKCVDVAKSLAESMRTEGGGAVTLDQATCVAKKLVKEESFRRGFRASLSGSGNAAAGTDPSVVRGLMADCGVSLG